MSKKHDKKIKEILDFMEKIEKEAPIIIPMTTAYVFKWGRKTYELMFERFPIKGNTITDSNKGITWR